MTPGSPDSGESGYGDVGRHDGNPPKNDNTPRRVASSRGAFIKMVGDLNSRIVKIPNFN